MCILLSDQYILRTAKRRHIEVVKVLKQEKKDEHGQKRPPLKLIWEKTENDEPQVGRHDRPAGARSVPADGPVGEPEAVDKRPPKKRGNRFPEHEERDQSQHRVKPPVEQVLPEPPNYTDAGLGRSDVVS